jgi:hypothetical protein
MSVPTPAVAGDPAASDAAELFREGREAMRTGDYAVACRKLEESERLASESGTLLNLAFCHGKLRNFRRARAALGQFFAMASAADDRRRPALELLAELEQRMPRLRIVIAPVIPDKAQIILDGEDVTRDAKLSALAIDPGHYVLEVNASGYVTERRVFDIEEGDQRRETIALRKPISPRPAAAKDATRTSAKQAQPGLPVAFHVSLAAGVAGLVAGVGSGIFVLHQRSVVEDHCENKRCDAEGIRAAEQGRLFAVINTVALPIGIAGMSVAGYLLVRHQSRESRGVVDISVTTNQAIITARTAF